MAEQSLKDRIAEIESLHQKYLDLRENTPEWNRDGEECKAYHKWYDAAYVFFCSLRELKGTEDFKTFVSAEKNGNCFVLGHIYDSISASYKVLMSQAQELGMHNAGGDITPHQADTWPFETNDNHRRVFISYSWDSDTHMKWVLQFCQDLRDRGVDAIIDKAMRKGKDLLDFMEKGIANAHRVLIIGTPDYKRKSEEKKGGVKYEQNIIKASILQGIGSDRYITILKEGKSFEESFPAVISTKGGYDLRNAGDYQEHLTALVHEIYDKPVLVLNPIGAVPDFASEEGNAEPVAENANDNYVTLVKRYLSSPEYNIAFSDLIKKMADEAFRKIMEKANYNIPLNTDVLTAYSDYHHEAVSDLMNAAILTAQWGTAKQLEMFGQVLARLSGKPFVNGQIERVGSELLHGIGAQYLFNVVGMACVKYERFAELERILTTSIPAPHFKDINRRQSVIRALGEQYWSNDGFNQLLEQNYYYPWTMWLKARVCPHFEPFFMVESEVESLYYIWEQLKSLVFGYYCGHTTDHLYFTTGFFLHYRAGLTRNIGGDDPYTVFYGGADKLKSEWPPIKQGMFGGDYELYQKLEKEAEEYYKKVIRW